MKSANNEDKEHCPIDYRRSKNSSELPVPQSRGLILPLDLYM